MFKQSYGYIVRVKPIRAFLGGRLIPPLISGYMKGDAFVLAALTSTPFSSCCCITARRLGLLSQDCEDFDKKVEKLQSEKGRRMEECLDELRGLEDGYRQKHRDAKQVMACGRPAKPTAKATRGNSGIE